MENTINDKKIEFSRLLKSFSYYDKPAYIVELTSNNKLIKYASFFVRKEVKTGRFFFTHVFVEESKFSLIFPNLSHFFEDLSESCLIFTQKDCSYLFDGSDITSFNIDLPNLVNGSHMFSDSKIQKIDSCFNNLETANHMFKETNHLKIIKLKFPKIKYIDNMFRSSNIENATIEFNNIFGFSKTFENSKITNSTIKINVNNNLSKQKIDFMPFHYSCIKNSNIYFNAKKENFLFLNSKIKDSFIYLKDLTEGKGIFQDSNIDNVSIFNPKLKVAEKLFFNSTIKNTKIQLDTLINGKEAFKNTDLYNTSFSFPNLENGDHMFFKSNISNFSENLPNLTNGYQMFSYSSLITFEAKFPKLKNKNILFLKNMNKDFVINYPHFFI